LDQDSNPLQIEGRNAVIEALRSETHIDRIYIVKGDWDKDRNSPLGFIAYKARTMGVAVVDADKRKLDSLSVTGAHQGVIATLPAAEYGSVEDILARAAERGEDPLIIVCDEIADPHNLGAIIRTAEASGAHGVIIPKRRGVGLTATVVKTSAGAAFHLPIARVPNITAALETLKKRGVWVYGADMHGGESLWNTDLTGPSAVVIGAEGSGMQRIVRQTCDRLINIPMQGKLSSLNASVSAAVIIYEIMRQRSICGGDL